MHKILVELIRHNDKGSEVFSSKEFTTDDGVTSPINFIHDEAVKEFGTNGLYIDKNGIMKRGQCVGTVRVIFDSKSEINI